MLLLSFSPTLIADRRPFFLIQKISSLWSLVASGGSAEGKFC